MSHSFNFSPKPNRAHEIAWVPWGEAAFSRAAAEGRPVLLNLTAVWSAWCHRMDETTFSDTAVVELINDAFVAVRVDSDRYPHVQDRYIAGGWPTTAFLTPTGEVLWAGTYVDAEQFQAVAASVLDAWRDRRDELEAEISRRHRALEAARGRGSDRGLVRRESADDVLTATCDTFDPRNGGFGAEPKFPHTDVIELLYAEGRTDPGCVSMADQSLDGMLAGELWDPVDGGFFRYATAADWTAPRYEKLLDVNAAMLEAYALGAWLRGRDDWALLARRIVEWVDGTLATDSGLWAGSQYADDDYFSADAAGRAARAAPPVDDTVYAAANARWIAALAAAGARLGDETWIARADAALRTLLHTMQAPDGGLFHFRERDGEPAIDFLLADTLEAARAACAVAQATGSMAWLDEAQRLVRHMESAYWAEDGGFWDRLRSVDDFGALRYRDRPVDLNATAARLLLEIAGITGERRCRALAERTLARIGSVAGRHGPAAARFALATSEFFDSPPAIVIAVPGEGGEDGATAAAGAAASAGASATAGAADAAGAAHAALLRRAAFAMAVPQLRVWTVPSGHTVGPQRFEVDGRAAAFIWTQRGCSAALPDAGRLADVGAVALLHA